MHPLAQKMDKIDFARSLKELYGTNRQIREVFAGPGTFLGVDGKGEPGGEDYRQAIGWLYPVAYTLKFSLKNAGVLDFAVGKMECLWYDDPAEVPMPEWRWRILIRVPDEVGEEEVKRAQEEIRERKGIDTSSVTLTWWEEGRCLQVLHVGPYDQEQATYESLMDRARELSLALKGPAHEIYLSDPRRVAPEKLRTIIRMPIA